MIPPDAGIRQLKLIVPPPPPRLVQRPRLWAMLDRLADLPVTVIAATAGYGKTTLLASWIATRPDPIAWYMADPSDTDLRLFVGGLVRAIRTVAPALGNDVESSLATGDNDPERLAARLGDDLARIDTHGHSPVILVIDNAHMANEPPIVQFLNALVRFPLLTLHLILAGQTALPLDIPHLAERGLVGDISEADLAFTPDESRRFLRESVGSAQSSADLNATIALAEGWVAALNMLSLNGESMRSLHASSSEEGHAPSGQRQLTTLVDGVVDRIVARWDPAFRRLMIALAIPDQICPGLVDAIGLDDGSMQPRRRLHHLSRSGYFLLPADDRGEWYRFHGLFRQALLDRRRAIFQDADYADICRRIARWHRDHGNVSAAIDALLEAGDARAAADFVADRLDRSLIVNQWDKVERWLNRLPADEVEHRPDFLMVRAWIAHTRGQNDLLRALSHTVTRHIKEGRIDPTTLPLIEAELSLFRTVFEAPEPSDRLEIYRRAYAALRGSNRFGEMVVLQSFLPLLGRTDRAEADRIIDSLLLENASRTDVFSQAHLFWVRFSQALMIGAVSGVAHGYDISRQVLAHAQRLNLHRGMAFGNLAVGSCLLANNQLTEATPFLRRAADNPHTSQLARVAATTRLARALDAQGCHAEADAVLQQTLDRLLEVDAIRFVHLVRTGQVWLAIRRGNLSRARALVSRLHIEERPAFVIGPEHPQIAKLALFAQGDDPREQAWADAAIAQILDDPATLHWNEPLIQVMVMQALRAERNGRPAERSAILRRAVAKAEQVGDLRVFSELGAGVEAMLAAFLAEHPTWTFLRERVAMLQAERARMEATQRQGEPPAVSLLPARTPSLEEQVTQRELDVLSGLQRRLTNKEIAAELSISPFTVKTHTQNIYAKLGVNSRRQAILRAAALDLKPSPRNTPANA